MSNTISCPHLLFVEPQAMAEGARGGDIIWEVGASLECWDNVRRILKLREIEEKYFLIESDFYLSSIVESSEMRAAVLGRRSGALGLFLDPFGLPLFLTAGAGGCGGGCGGGSRTS